MKKFLAFTLFMLLVPCNMFVSTVYMNYFDSEMGALQYEFATSRSDDMNCSWNYSDQNGAYLGRCSGGILQERDDLVSEKNLWALGSWTEGQGYIYRYDTFRFYFYKFWRWRP